MKSKLMTHKCMNKECDFEEISHKIRDGMKCPECDGPIMSYYHTRLKQRVVTQ